ncbi:MAG: hypothetical protein AAF738_09275, partial [Bacteroidota bacterium]
QLNDIITFAPALSNNRFFARNRALRLNLKGSVKGNVNNMLGKNVDIALEDGSRLRGNYTARNLTLPGKAELYLRTQPLQVRVSTLRRILPNFDLPPNFDKLGLLNYTGRFNMLANRFQLDGKLQSSLGYADLNIELQNSPMGLAQATYAGSLDLVDFDLAKWTGNKEFGSITLKSVVQEGRGLTGATADARLSVDVETFEFRGYPYENAQFTGRLNDRLFNGDLSLKDDNIAFDFKGKVDYTGTRPLFDFTADIARLRLQALNLYKKDLELAGQIVLELQNDKPSEMVGKALVQNLAFKTPNYQEHIDSVKITSDLDERGIRTINLTSNVANADIAGYYNLSALPHTLLTAFQKNFPTYAQRIPFPKRTERKVDSLAQFTALLDVKNSGSLTKIFIPKLDTLKNIKLTSYFDYASSTFELNATTPYVAFDSIGLHGTKIIADAAAQSGSIHIEMDEVTLKNGKRSQPIRLKTEIDTQRIAFNLNYAPNIDNVIRQLDLSGTVQLLDSTRTRFTLSPDSLSLFSTQWQLDEDNYIEVEKKQVDIKNFLLQDNKGRTLRLMTSNQKDVSLIAKGFQLGIIDTFWNYPLLDFGGKFDLNIRAADVFQMKNLSLLARADTFLINGDNYGNMTLEANADDLKSRLYPKLSITKDT